MAHIADGLTVDLIDDTHFVLERCCHRQQKTEHNNGCTSKVWSKSDSGGEYIEIDTEIFLFDK